MKKTIFKLLIYSFILVPLSLQAQLTEAFTEADRPYKDAWELYLKEKYGAARREFETYLNSSEGSQHLRTNAAFYRAICAYELFHPDAERLLEEFTARHPESTKAPLAWFYLGRHHYRNKRYTKALPALERADIYYLTGEEVPEYYFKLGYCQFNKGDNEKALKNFKEISGVVSKYQTAAIYYSGHIAYASGNYKTALELFARLDSSATFGPLVPYYITQMHFDQGKYKEVISYAVPVLKEKSPQNNVDIMRIVAESYYRTGDYKNALVYFDGYRQGTPYLSRDDYYSIAFCEYRSGNHKNAIPFFEKVIGQQDSLEQNAWYHLGDCYIKTGDKKAARNAFQLASKMDQNAALKEKSLFNFAKLSYELKLPGALTAFRELLEKFPKTALADESNELLAELYLSTRNYKDAFAALDNVRNKTTRSMGAYQKVAYYRGVELFNDGSYDKSVGMFEKAILTDIDPGLKARAIYWKAEVLYRQEKFELATKQYRSFIFNPGSVNTDLYLPGHYNLGYCYFKQGNYSEAQSWFRKFIGGKPEPAAQMLNDALLRTADCQYALRDFSNALRYYEEAIGNKAASADYALFQKGMIQGLQGDHQAKVNTLTSLISAYNKSTFRGDALFERGRARMTLTENDKARQDFNALLREYPSHAYARKAKLNNGLMYYNDKQDDEALREFKQLIGQFPGTPEASEALAAVKNIYVGNGNPNEYFDFVRSIPNASVSAGAQDSITYEAAEQRYLKGDFSNAGSDFENYLKQFPQGAYKLNATFYRAECQYRIKSFAEALQGYEAIIAAPANIFTEKSLAKAGQIRLAEKQYEPAIAHYQRLEQIAELRDNIIAAHIGLMRALHATAQHEQAIVYAQKLIQAETVNPEVVTEAHLIHARSSMALNDLVTSKKEFSAISKNQGQAGAEAKYQLANIDYKMGNFKASQNKCYDVANSVPSYDFWIGKSFILLADNFIALKDTFQAKATLQSILENYEKDPADPEDIRAIAQEKLDAILKQEEESAPKPENQPEPETDLNKESDK
jgi:TolA-binding protein